jgi:DDE domain
MDETYIKAKGVCHYLYRADKDSDTIDFLLSKKPTNLQLKPFLTQFDECSLYCTLMALFFGIEITNLTFHVTKIYQSNMRQHIWSCSNMPLMFLV